MFPWSQWPEPHVRGSTRHLQQCLHAGPRWAAGTTRALWTPTEAAGCPRELLTGWGTPHSSLLIIGRRPGSPGASLYSDRHALVTEKTKRFPVHVRPARHPRPCVPPAHLMGPLEGSDTQRSAISWATRRAKPGRVPATLEAAGAPGGRPGESPGPQGHGHPSVGGGGPPPGPEEGLRPSQRLARCSCFLAFTTISLLGNQGSLKQDLGRQEK